MPEIQNNLNDNNSITWSVMIPTYNAAKYIRILLESVLSQGISESKMEIIVVDDRSKDNTEELVKEIGKGRVKFVVNEVNQGIMKNFVQCTERANGKLVHVLHQDDVLLPGFYEEFEKKFTEYPEVGMVSCNVHLINEQGDRMHTMGPVRSLLTPSKDVSQFLYENPFRAPGVVVKKEVYNKIGSFDPNLTYVGDWDMWLRAIHNFGGVHIDKALCKYRRHKESGTKSATKSGENILDKERLFNKFRELGYPIDMNKANAVLRLSAKISYESKLSVGDKQSQQMMKEIYLRYTNPVMPLISQIKVSSFLFLKSLGITGLAKKILGRK